MKKEESSSSEEETSSEESEEEDEEEEKPVVKPAATRTDSLLARSSQAREVASPTTRSGYSSPSYKGSFDRDNSPKYGSSSASTTTATPHRVRPTPMHTEPEENRYSGSR